jgi:hypothetical protein
MDQHKTSIKTICSLHALNAGATFYQRVKIDAFVKSPDFSFSVIPAKAGIQCFQTLLDAGSSPA